MYAARLARCLSPRTGGPAGHARTQIDHAPPPLYDDRLRASEGEQGARDHAIVVTLLGTGLRRAELIGLRIADLDLGERRLRIRGSTSKSVHPREITLPPEVVKVLDRYVHDYRRGDNEDEAPLFTDRRGNQLTGQAVRRLFDRLKTRTGIRDLCAHMLRHTWATNYNRSKSGSTFDLQVEGG